MDHREKNRRVSKAWRHANAELRDRHDDEFRQLLDFYRNEAGVPVESWHYSWSGDRPKAPPYKKRDEQ